MCCQLDRARHPGKLSGLGDDGFVRLQSEFQNRHGGAYDVALHGELPQSGVGRTREVYKAGTLRSRVGQPCGVEIWEFKSGGKSPRLLRMRWQATAAETVIRFRFYLLMSSLFSNRFTMPANPIWNCVGAMSCDFCISATAPGKSPLAVSTRASPECTNHISG